MKYINLDEPTFQNNRCFNVMQNGGRVFITAKEKILFEFMSKHRLFLNISLTAGDTMTHDGESDYVLITNLSGKANPTKASYVGKEGLRGISMSWQLRQ